MALQSQIDINFMLALYSIATEVAITVYSQSSITYASYIYVVGAMAFRLYSIHCLQVQCKDAVCPPHPPVEDIKKSILQLEDTFLHHSSEFSEKECTSQFEAEKNITYFTPETEDKECISQLHTYSEKECASQFSVCDEAEKYFAPETADRECLLQLQTYPEKECQYDISLCDEAEIEYFAPETEEREQISQLHAYNVASIEESNYIYGKCERFCSGQMKWVHVNTVSQLLQ